MAKDQPNRLPPGMDMLDMPAGFDQDRLEEVLKIKEQANQKFKESDYFSAKCLYAGALEMLERCCLHLEKADETWEGIKNNMALCDLKRQEWTRVIDTTTEILTRNPSNTKALYRRGVARIGQGKLAEAQLDLKSVVEIEPGNVDARQKLVEVQQQLRQQRSQERDQAEKLRGFLRGERLDDTVAVSEDGGVRKLHGNENAPLFSAWIKRAWLQPNSGLSAVVTAHVVMKTPAGKEVWNTRKPPGYLTQQPVGPHMVSQPKPAQRPAEPSRWVLDDAFGGVFAAWNSAAKSLQLHELGRFEVAKYTLGPSVETAVDRCLQTWLSDTPARRELFRDVPEDVQVAARRRQALQILGLPEEFCMDAHSDRTSTLNMEMELLEVSELVDLHGDGRHLLQVIREGKKRAPGVPVVIELSKVTAHFRISKLLPNYSLKDTRMGLANTSDGLVLREDKTKEPVEFIVGEAEAVGEGEFVPPCIGDCLLLPPGGVVEGMHFELILREGVPVSHMEKAIFDAYADGISDSMPDTTGPVSIRIEVEQVAPPLSGPSTPGWKGIESLQQERQRAEELQLLEGGRHCAKALRRWRRIISWLEEVLEGRRWRLQGGGGSSMYDLEWDEEGDGREADAQPQEARGTELPPPPPAIDRQPEMLEVDEELLRQLEPDELCEWATAHAAAAKVLEGQGDLALSLRHARCVVQASQMVQLPKEVEIRGRSTLAARLIESGQSAEALEVLRVAQALDPTSGLLRDQAAIASQRDSDRRTLDLKGSLKVLKQELDEGLQADDVPRLLRLLTEVNGLQLTWEAVHESAIGKEVGKCAKHPDAEVVDQAKAIIAMLHKLAKQQRPMWVR